LTVEVQAVKKAAKNNDNIELTLGFIAF
jgi:hypothetical protein